MAFKRQESLLDEPFKLFRIIGTAVVSGPGMTDGEFVELEHIHDPNLSYRTTEELGLLVYTCRWKKKHIDYSSPTVYNDQTQSTFTRHTDSHTCT